MRHLGARIQTAVLDHAQVSEVGDQTGSFFSMFCPLTSDF
jgi:hypothetical protein